MAAVDQWRESAAAAAAAAVADVADVADVNLTTALLLWESIETMTAGSQLCEQVSSAS